MDQIKIPPSLCHRKFTKKFTLKHISYSNYANEFPAFQKDSCEHKLFFHVEFKQPAPEIYYKVT